MSNSLQYNNADWLMFSFIFDSKAFEWQGCKPEFEKYDRYPDEPDFKKWYEDRGIQYIIK